MCAHTWRFHRYVFVFHLRLGVCIPPTSFYVSVIFIIYPNCFSGIKQEDFSRSSNLWSLPKDAELTVLSAYVLAEWNGQLGE